MKKYGVILLCLFILMTGCQSKEQSSVANPSEVTQFGGNESEQNNKDNRSLREKLIQGKLKDSATKGELNSSQQESPVSREGIQFFVGDWAIWIPGSFSESKSSDTADGTVQVSREYVFGQQGKVLSIYEDGTYRWETPTEVITGNWSDNGDGRIVLLAGQWDFDWYVEKTSEHEIKYYSFGVEEYGTRMEE